MFQSGLSVKQTIPKSQWLTIKSSFPPYGVYSTSKLNYLSFGFGVKVTSPPHVFHLLWTCDYSGQVLLIRNCEGGEQKHTIRNAF